MCSVLSSASASSAALGKTSSALCSRLSLSSHRLSGAREDREMLFRPQCDSDSVDSPEYDNNDDDAGDSLRET